jgi:hypothetical protein
LTRRSLKMVAYFLFIWGGVFGSIGVWTWGLMLARQSLNHLATPLSPFWHYFPHRVSCFLAQTDHPSYASRIAGITGMYHHVWPSVCFVLFLFCFVLVTFLSLLSQGNLFRILPGSLIRRTQEQGCWVDCGVGMASPPMRLWGMSLNWRNSLVVCPA